MNDAIIDKVVINVSKEGVDNFINLLQSGIEIEATTKESVLDTIQKLDGFTTDYIDNEVQTIFLDGTALDDITVPLDKETSTIALSAAMPGLSGAIYRRNSIHSSLRSVQHDAQKSTEAPVAVKVKLKLFNAIARDRGPDILKNGITLEPKQLINFLKPREWLLGHVHSILVDGKIMPIAELQKQLSQKQRVHLQLTTDASTT